MRKQSIWVRFSIPIFAAFLLLPPLSGLAFYYTATHYAYTEATRNVETLQDRLSPLLTETDQRSFLRQIGPLLANTPGNGRLLLLSRNRQIIYPRDEDSRAVIAPLAKELSWYIDQTSPLPTGTTTFHSADGTTYILNMSHLSLSNSPIAYAIAYCPMNAISQWVWETTVLVCVIAAVLACMLAIIMTCLIRSITRPLQGLCAEAARIGQGDFTAIDGASSVRELEELRQAMNHMAAQLDQADKGQRHFFQTISHELRTPLMSISGYAQGIEEEVFPNPREAARVILEESLRLTELVNKILTLSRLDRLESDKTTASVEICDIIYAARDRFQGLALRQHLTIDVTAPEEDLYCPGSADVYTHIFDNLLSNALRYAKTSVSIVVTADESTVTCVISDDGPGIADEDMPHIFDRAYAGKGGNFGLGLAIAREGAKKSGGSLTGRNNPDGGASFSVTLPRQ